MDDIANTFNVAQPIVYGGTGATSVITAWDAINAKGTDVATAGTVNLTTATGPNLTLTGTTTVTAVTLAEGNVRFARANAVFQLTASANLIINGSASTNYTTTAGDLLIFIGGAAGVARVWTLPSGTAANYFSGYTTTATAAGTTTLTSASTFQQFFTGTTTQTLVLPVTSTLTLGQTYRVVNNSTGSVTVQSSGANTIAVLPPGSDALFTVILTSGTTAASWDFKFGGTLTTGVPVASTSGTSIDFNNIPAWVKRITVNLVGVSTNGTSLVIIQTGDSGGIETTGYLGAAVLVTSASSVNYNTGFNLAATLAAGSLLHGSFTLELAVPASNAWAGGGNIALAGDGVVCVTAGSKSLSAPLDRVRVTTVNGTDTFDAGTINITYE
jgi:hypothetical protein